MKHKMYRGLTWAILFSFLMAVTGFKPLLSVKAAVPGSVVINEIAWAGSVDSSTDEYIELYNNSDQTIDLTNWVINDNHGAYLYKILSGTIAAHGYFLIEDHEATVSTVTSDAIINMTLANNGQNLELFDANGLSIDNVNSAGGAWFAGNATTKATMERIDPAVSGDLASNWATSTGTGDKSSNGGAFIGTPKRANSAQNNPQTNDQKVTMSLDKPAPMIGDIVTATVKAIAIKDLFAYGFDFAYDPAVLKFKSAAVKTFLSQNNLVATSFQAALENGTEGKLIVAEARTNEVKNGVTGDGDLFTMQFEVVGGPGALSSVNFDAKSFVANPFGDTVAQFVNLNFTPKNKQVDAVSNLKAVQGVDRYSLQLTWDALSGVTGYRIFRQNVHDQWVKIGESEQASFVDKDGVSGAGNIVPSNDYHYRVVAFNDQMESLPIDVMQKEMRGLKGDNNRSDRVDGRDLEKLAQHFGESDADLKFDPIVDTTYDGQINGSDLIDIGAQFAKTYSA